MAHGVFIFNARLLDESIDGPGAVFILEGKIRAVFLGYFTSEETVKQLALSVLKDDGCENCNMDFFNARGLTVTPSFVDMHVHFRYPGQTEKEDLESGIKAAIAGGYSTVVTMPNTSPVVSSQKMAIDIVNQAKQFGPVKIIQSVSITKDFEGVDTSHLDEIEKEYVPLITEDGRDVMSTAVMLEGMKKASKKELIVSCHCEDNELAKAARPYRQNALELMKKYNLPAWGGTFDFESVDDEVLEEIDNQLTQANEILALAEDVATNRNIAVAKLANCHIHLAHVSTANSIESIRIAKASLLEDATEYADDKAQELLEPSLENTNYAEKLDDSYGFNVTCEVTPHHIALTGTEEPNIRALVNPPLRTEGDRLVVLDAIRDGTVDVISTDHAPHTITDKANGAPGFTGLETAFAVCNTVLVKGEQIEPRRLSQLMSANPSRILNLNKGLLKAGYDGDITVIDPDEVWNVCVSNFYSKGKASPFEGKSLTGKVKSVFIEGIKVF